MHILNKHTVPQGTSKQRLSDYLVGIFQELPSRKSVKKAITKGAVYLDGKIGKTGDWVNSDQVIALTEIDVPVAKVYRLEVQVCYEDEHLAVIVKPAGIPVSGNQFRTIENALLHSISISTEPDKLLRPRAAHRLDAPTAGLLLIAKTKRARMALGQQFEQKQIEKTYLALVTGKLEGQGSWYSPIEGKKAHSDYKSLQYGKSLRSQHLSLVQLYPHTGRTHQLRIHLAEAGHPIVGDLLYGTEGEVLKHKGLFLFAQKIKFLHPHTQKAMFIELPIPYKYTRRLESEQNRWERKNL